MIFAQIEQAAEVVKIATLQGGWLAGFLVIIVLAALALFGVLIRGDRSELRDINRFVRNEMADVIDGHVIMMSRFVSALHNRPCLHDSDLDKINGIDPRSMDQHQVNELDGVTKRAAERVRKRETRREQGKEGDSDT